MSTKRFRIWMLAKWYPNKLDPQLGVFIQKHARAISKYDDISVLSVFSVERQERKFETEIATRDGVNEIIVYFRKSKSVIARIVNYIRYRNAMRIGIEELNRISPKPELIHAYILLRTGLAALFQSRRRKIPFIVSEQWSGYATGKFSESSSLKKYMIRRVAKMSSALVSVSEFLKKKMEECSISNESFLVVPNVIERIDGVNSMQKENTVNVLMVADLVDEIKNISGAIRMIGSLSIETPFVLRIIGAGRDENTLKELASSMGLLGSKIFFEGLKPNEEVYDYLRRCDFLLMNSRFETFSLICAEAMSCGKPVLATRCGGPDEFVTQDTGVLIEVDNSDELRSGFVHMLAHHKEFKSEKIIDHVREKFSMERAGKLYHEIYESATRKFAK